MIPLLNNFEFILNSFHFNTLQTCNMSPTSFKIFYRNERNFSKPSFEFYYRILPPKKTSFQFQY